MSTIILAVTDCTDPSFTLYLYDTMREHADPSTDDPCHATGEAYWTRFGDYVCGCHVGLGWSPQRVRDGVFSEDTADWTQRTEAVHLAWYAEAERAAKLERLCPRYCGASHPGGYGDCVAPVLHTWAEHHDANGYRWTDGDAEQIMRQRRALRAAAATASA